MAVAYGGAQNTGPFDASQNNNDLALTVSAGTNMVVVAGIDCGGGVVSATWNGTSMTQIASVFNLSVWALAIGTTAATANLHFVKSGFVRAVAGVTYFTGVDQTTPTHDPTTGESFDNVAALAISNIGATELAYTAVTHATITSPISAFSGTTFLGATTDSREFGHGYKASSPLQFTLTESYTYDIAGFVLKVAASGVIKTIDGLAIASVKTLNGTAKASGKTFNGTAL